MLVTQAYRFALDPTPAQQRALASHCGASRFAYNWGLRLVKDRPDERERLRDAGYREQLSDVEVEELARRSWPASTCLWSALGEPWVAQLARRVARLIAAAQDHSNAAEAIAAIRAKTSQLAAKKS